MFADMETLRTIFLEDPAYILVGLGVVEMALIAAWCVRRSGRVLKLLAWPVALGVVVFAVAWFVVTDREYIRQAANDIAADFQRGSSDAAARYLDEKYTGFGQDKPTAILLANHMLAHQRIRKIKLSHCNIRVEGQQAEMKINSVVHFEGGDIGMLSLGWRIRWVKRPAPTGWQIAHVKPPTQTLPGFTKP